MFLARTCLLLASLCGVLQIFAESAPCFITNCPPGGKRSSASLSFHQRHQKTPLLTSDSHHKCNRCGPDGLGICVGAHICCGSTIGCYINTEETAPCSDSFKSSSACYRQLQDVGNHCGNADWEGTCVAPNLCCSFDSCRIDGNCQLSKRDESFALGEVELTAMEIPVN